MVSIKKEKRNLAKSFLFILLYPLFFFSKKIGAKTEISDFEKRTGFSNYGWPSKFVKIFRWINANPAMKGNGVSYTPLSSLEGAITPNGLHFERHHYGVKDINSKKYSLKLDGNIEYPINFSLILNFLNLLNFFNLFKFITDNEYLSENITSIHLSGDQIFLI